jgi:hypothetical protein
MNTVIYFGFPYNRRGISSPAEGILVSQKNIFPWSSLFG